VESISAQMPQTQAFLKGQIKLSKSQKSQMAEELPLIDNFRILSRNVAETPITATLGIKVPNLSDRIAQFSGVRSLSDF
jgi:hypothetical protein